MCARAEMALLRNTRPASRGEWAAARAHHAHLHGAGVGGRWLSIGAAPGQPQKNVLSCMSRPRFLGKLYREVAPVLNFGVFNGDHGKYAHPRAIQAQGVAAPSALGHRGVRSVGLAGIVGGRVGGLLASSKRGLACCSGHWVAKTARLSSAERF
jgi:hypothetical protein